MNELLVIVGKIAYSTCVICRFIFPLGMLKLCFTEIPLLLNKEKTLWEVIKVFVDVIGFLLKYFLFLMAFMFFV